MAENINKFAKIISSIQKSDRWNLIVCTGDMGEGKSCFTSQLGKIVAEENNTSFSFEDNMTFQRKELKEWIDGSKTGKKRKKEYSVILADELISMFFKRNWFDAYQIDGIELLNKCRDRHLCILGNVPNFWDLDSAMYALITFRVHIHERGRAWVFQKDRNPFATDPWHKKENVKIFQKHKNPYRCVGFVCEIHFPDWSAAEKKAYYTVRNKKRVKTEGQRVEKHRDIKQARDNMIRFILDYNKKITNFVKQDKKTVAEYKQFMNKLLPQQKDLTELTGLSEVMISYIKTGQR